MKKKFIQLFYYEIKMSSLVFYFQRMNMVANLLPNIYNFLFTPELDYALLCHIILLKKQIFEIRFVCKQLGKHKQIIIVLMWKLISHLKSEMKIVEHGKRM